MGREPRRGEIVEIVALVKERGFRRIQIFCRRILFQRTATEGDHAPAQVGDRKHHAIAEAVIGQRDVVARHQKSGLDHVLDGNAERPQVLLQGKTFARRARRIADAELKLRRRRDRAVAEITPSLGAVPGSQHVGKKFRRQFHDIVKRLAALLMACGIRGRGGHGHAGHRGQPLDGFRKGDPLGLHHEVEDVAVLAGGEIVIELLLVIDGKGRRLFLLEWRQSLPLPPCLLQLHAAADHFRNRKPGAQFVKKFGREAHRIEFR